MSFIVTTPSLEAGSRDGRSPSRARTSLFWAGRAADLVGMLPRRLQRALLRATPGSSASWGPPRRWGTAAEVARSAGGEWCPLFGVTREENYPRVIRAADRVTLAALEPTTWSPAGLAIVPRGRVLSPHGFAVGADDRFLVDASFARGGVGPEIWRLPRVRRTSFLSGRVLNLGSTWGAYNFAHQLLDVWPRWELVRRAGWHWEDFDHVLAPAPSFAVCAAVAERIGLPRERLRSLQRGEQACCETLVQPTHPCGLSAAHYPRWVLDFFRQLRWPAAADAPRRIYVTRSAGRRGLANEAALTAALAEEGFVTIDAAALGRLAPGWFAAAEEIIGPHGAALAHLVFATPGARILELLPCDHVVAYYASLAGAAGLDYGAVAGSRQQSKGPAAGTFTVEIDHVLSALHRLRGRTRRERKDRGPGS